MISQYNRAKRVVTKLITCKKKIICALRQKNKIVHKVKARASAKGKSVRLQEVKQQQRRSLSRAAAFDYSGVKEQSLFNACRLPYSAFMSREILIIISTADMSAVFNSVMGSLCSSRHFKAGSMLMIFTVFGQVGE